MSMNYVHFGRKMLIVLWIFGVDGGRDMLMKRKNFMDTNFFFKDYLFEEVQYQSGKAVLFQRGILVSL